MKRLLFFSIFSCLTSPLLASFFPCETLVEIRGGYFWFAEDTAREIYDNGAGDVEGEVAVFLNPCLTVWGNYNYISKNGHSIGLGDPTHLSLSTLSSGIKFLHTVFCPDLDVYLGVGGTYALLKIRDDSPFVIPVVEKNTFGFVAKSGFLYFFSSCFYLDIFTDYYYQPMKFKSRPGIQRFNANLGGFRFGAGLGVHF